ncbi:RNase H domain-containing protein [Trichonephila clavipes]|nr:RNase H domain-containing protein [Trichonephila clavipes]
MKYYIKLSCLGFQNRTSKFLRSWSSHQRLKRGSLFGHVVSGHLVASSIEHHSFSEIIDPSEGFDGVYFHVNLSIQVSEQNELPCYLKQLPIERISYAFKEYQFICARTAVNLVVTVLAEASILVFGIRKLKSGEKSGLLLCISFRACCNS